MTKPLNKSLSHALGDLTDLQQENQGVIIYTTFGKVRLTVYSKSVLRIHAVQEDFEKSHSYAVVAEPESTEYTLEEAENSYVINTGVLQLVISKNPVRFSLLTPIGQVVNEDDTALGISWLGEQVGCYKKLRNDERFLGLGEKTGPLDRRGEAYINWNTDNPNHQPGDDPLYASIPFYIGVHSGASYGIFFDNSHKTHFNFGASTDRFSSFTADAGEMDYYLIHHPHIKDIIKSYTWLTGRMPMPPKWALGYQQCRWSYFPESELLNVARTFRKKKIPADVIYFDIDYMQDYKLFTWSQNYFPNPKETIETLRNMDFHAAVIVDPGVKKEEGYHTYDDGIKNDVFVKYPDGSNYSAEVWPGMCHFPDFTDPEVRKWWGEQFRELVNLGVEGYWNDMNEIASWGGGATPELVEFHWEGEKTTYRQAKNVYGMQMARATHEGVTALMENRRPMILTRAGFAGLQRHSALWTGDNQATDEHMLLGVRLVNSIGLSGVPFTGVDVGGFGGDATKELFARWIAIGAFSPFFRGHAAYDTRSSEPWTYGETVETIARNYIQLRYNLLPYLYSIFFEAHQSGMPVARSLAIDYPHDQNIYETAYQNEYLFGPAILVAPEKSSQKLTKVYLPEGDWYDFYSDKRMHGNKVVAAESPIDQLPLYIKAGSIIPLQSPVQSTFEPPRNTLYLNIYKGDTKNRFFYYEDDGESLNYRSGAYYKRCIEYDPFQNRVVLDEVEGNFPSHFSEIKLLLHGFDNAMVSINEETYALREGRVNYLAPDKNPIGEGFIVPVKTVTVPLTNDRMEIYVG